jgi:hypothetical protein
MATVIHCSSTIFMNKIKETSSARQCVIPFQINNEFMSSTVLIRDHISYLIGQLRYGICTEVRHPDEPHERRLHVFWNRELARAPLLQQHCHHALSQGHIVALDRFLNENFRMCN